MRPTSRFAFLTDNMSEKDVISKLQNLYNIGYRAIARGYTPIYTINYDNGQDNTEVVQGDNYTSVCDQVTLRSHLYLSVKDTIAIELSFAN